MFCKTMAFPQSLIFLQFFVKSCYTETSSIEGFNFLELLKDIKPPCTIEQYIRNGSQIQTIHTDLNKLCTDGTSEQKLLCKMLFDSTKLACQNNVKNTAILKRKIICNGTRALRINKWIIDKSNLQDEKPETLCQKVCTKETKNLCQLFYELGESILKEGDQVREEPVDSNNAVDDQQKQKSAASSANTVNNRSSSKNSVNGADTSENSDNDKGSYSRTETKDKTSDVGRKSKNNTSNLISGEFTV
ncbi:unnamed protein product [Didymodactylos carnosus]|uniref:Uncharacterized protein n=2 Tax=Didymodactylos carnosus TaxID=1234261 RepID=A0A813Y9S3_9BILA|nr:unnamed protein product [Didymodactylos carnosus]CAF3667281.1 unnamed protein product [Didymodactylos carnosus]